ncbi:class II fumarate hydratase [Salinispirillum sp. LH 10-3-1]|uniref:fumarate hydratase n=1 Tax=Salinispirillum sp. LH 10-3-1 TaxID=2952525 RepID=A0AB38YBT9_9GAMM
MPAPKRTEKDSLGTIDVPTDALFGAQTQRAVNNFHFSPWRMPPEWLQTLALIKQAAALANGELGELDTAKAEAIQAAAQDIVDGELLDHFPVDVFQTGSGTSSNMNMNEVLARSAAQKSGLAISPNDDVNRGQSSNDVIPTCNHLMAAVMIDSHLLPALRHLCERFDALSTTYGHIVKTGRTHLMDAMPISVAQEIDGWRQPFVDIEAQLEINLRALCQLTLGGTAVGTGVNAHDELGQRVAQHLSLATGLTLTRTQHHFSLQSGQQDLLALSGTLRQLATWLIKVANDLRWMNSGPLAGLQEAQLPALQPGSSIMPGKVNPVIPEAVVQAAFQIIGNDQAIALAAQNGQFQLNTSMPLIAYNLHLNITLASRSCRALADMALAGLVYNETAINAPLARNPILATVLNPVIGYDAAADIAKTAYATGRSVLDVAMEKTDLSEEELKVLLDPARLV